MLETATSLSSFLHGENSYLTLSQFIESFDTLLFQNTYHVLISESFQTSKD